MTRWLAESALACSALPALLTCCNLLLYRRPRPVPHHAALPTCTVVVPARNEEAAIAACVESVLATTGVAIECIVMDDASTDRTRAICESIAQKDARLCVIPAPQLPAGWNGKQHACWCGTQLSHTVNILFLDADVRLAPEAIARMSAFMVSSRSSLVSGIPLEETATLLEKMLLPLIHFLLLGYLPMPGLRLTNMPGFGAGCGQFLLVNREAYFRAGGHAAIRTTMHDGLQLPRLFRIAGLHTDMADITQLATCRMYRSAAEVWNGLAKNATEGIASAANIVPFTALLLFGQVLPMPLLVAAYLQHSAHISIAAVAVVLSYLPRAINAVRFSQSWLGVLLHPLDVATLLVLQWQAAFRKLAGRQPTWKQRSYDAG